MVLQAEIPKGPCHGKAWCILVWQPHSGHVWFVIHGENSPLAIQNPCEFTYRSKKTMYKMQSRRIHIHFKN